MSAVTYILIENVLFQVSDRKTWTELILHVLTELDLLDVSSTVKNKHLTLDTDTTDYI